MTPDDLAKITEELIANLGLSLKADVSQDGELYLVNLNGSDARFLERGKDNKAGALITIIKLIVKQRHDIEPKLVLDLNNQRKERLQNVAQMARKMAEMVRLKGVEEELPPMTPAERRAVHMELKKMSGITTESRGVEPHRRIVIVADESKIAEE